MGAWTLWVAIYGSEYDPATSGNAKSEFLKQTIFC